MIENEIMNDDCCCCYTLLVMLILFVNEVLVLIYDKQVVLDIAVEDVLFDRLVLLVALFDNDNGFFVDKLKGACLNFSFF